LVIKCSLEYYKKCETCDPASGLNSNNTKCIKCKTKNCGVCNDNYKKCDAKITKCSANVKTVASKAIQGRYSPDTASTFNYCQNEPGFTGNGYSSLFTPVVKNGVCIDCNGDNFRPYSEGGMRFCSFDRRGRKVAAMAFKKKSGCSYPGSIKFTLDRTCLLQSGTKPFYINLIYSAKYCGEEKTVIASGGGFYKGPKDRARMNPGEQWRYIIKP